MTATLKAKYENEIVPALCKERSYKNKLQAPKMAKIVVNMGFNANMDKDAFKQAIDELGRITGQRPLQTKAKLSISNFKLREGMPIGAKVTLRGARMYELLDRLINASLPRIRDFRGIPSTAFDGRGNYNLGIKEQTMFPEIDPDKVKRNQGMDITIVTTASTDEEARDLLRGFGMPFATES